MNLKDEWLKLSYYQNKGSNENTGFGFRYGRFVQNLRKLCKDHKNIELIKGNVFEIIENQNNIKGVELRNGSGEKNQIHAKLTIICQGSLSPLGKSLNKSRIAIKGYMIGLILKECALPYEQHGHIILTDPAPVISYPVAKNKIRVLIDIPSESKTLNGSTRRQYLKEKVLPQMPIQLQEAFKKAVDEGGLKAKPTCLLASRPIVKKGVLLLGDSLNMRHPITGGGMTVALTDVKDLSDRLNHPGDLDKKSVVNDLIISFYRQRHDENASINILAFALYSVFKHNLLKKACFNYLQKGGMNAIEPMSILSGLSRDRKTLFKHFFAVAGYALFHKNKMGNNPEDSGFIQSITAFIYSVKILIPLIIDEIPRIYRNQNV
jgi:squalene monooxygenase